MAFTMNFIFSCDEVRVRSSMDDKVSYNDLEIGAFRGQTSISAEVIEVTDFKYEVRCNLRCCLEPKKA